MINNKVNILELCVLEAGLGDPEWVTMKLTCPEIIITGSATGLSN
jgi:hypothetical protein